MNVWFVMSTLGLFQVDGGIYAEPIYEIGSPLFKKAVIHLNSKYHPGSTFMVEACNKSNGLGWADV
jgi:putative alpha-1,2-mannosidase